MGAITHGAVIRGSVISGAIFLGGNYPRTTFEVVLSVIKSTKMC